MCNLYSQTKFQDAMRHVFDDMLEEDEELIDSSGNLPPMPGIFPDYAAPIIRHRPQGGWQLTRARWGMPTPQVFLAGRRTDPGGKIAPASAMDIAMLHLHHGDEKLIVWHGLHGPVPILIHIRPCGSGKATPAARREAPC